MIFDANDQRCLWSVGWKWSTNLAFWYSILSDNYWYQPRWGDQQKAKEASHHAYGRRMHDEPENSTQQSYNMCYYTWTYMLIFTILMTICISARSRISYLAKAMITSIKPNKFLVAKLAFRHIYLNWIKLNKKNIDFSTQSASAPDSKFWINQSTNSMIKSFVNQTDHSSLA